MEITAIYRFLILLLSIGFFLVAYSLHYDYQKSKFHILYVRLFFILGIFFLLIHLIAASDSGSEAWFWTYFLVVAHLFYPIVNDSLIRLYGKSFLRKRNQRLILLYSPFLILITLDLLWPELTIGDPVLTPYGWVYVNLVGSPVFYIHQIVYFVNISLMLFLVFGIWITKHDQETKTYVIFFFLTFLLPFVLYIIVSFLFDSTNTYIIPFTALGGTLSMLFIILFLIRFRVFNISPEIAAQDIISNMNNMLFLTNKEFRIQQINTSVRELLRYRDSELLGRFFYDYIKLGEDDVMDFLDLSGNELELISKSGSSIPVLINIIPVLRNNKLHGYAILGLDRSKPRKTFDEQQWIDLKLKSLQSAMNPHFLYNAIFSLKDQIVKGRILNATEYLSGLGSMYRLILNNINRNFISVADEIKLLHTYLSLEKQNFSSGFTYDIEIIGDNSVCNLLIPPMLIQPFVENSIKHGFRKGELEIESKRLEIKLNYISNNLTVTIDDNGIGRNNAFSACKDSNIKNGYGIGNICERIDLINSKDHPLKINLDIIDKTDSASNPIGTKVVLNFLWK